MAGWKKVMASKALHTLVDAGNDEVVVFGDDDDDGDDGSRIGSGGDSGDSCCQSPAFFVVSCLPLRWRVNNNLLIRENKPCRMLCVCEYSGE